MKTYPSYRPTPSEPRERLRCNKTIRVLDIANSQLQNRINFENAITEKINDFKIKISRFKQFQGYRFTLNEYKVDSHKTRSKKFTCSLREMFNRCFDSLGKTPNGASVNISWDANDEICIKLIIN